MANSGVGNKFTSVNLNKSYGQSNHSNTSHYGMGRGSRPVAGGGGSGGGGMVVLSRPRSAHKAGPKLSVPPPLNLPSLRKEHEKFDSLGPGGGGSGGGVAGGGARPSSAGLGWSKPSAIVGGEKEAVVGDRPLSSEGVDHVAQGVDGVNRGGGSTAYMPPSARTDVSVTMPLGVEKASVLRGEDFPSLRATLSAANGPTQKQKDPGHQKPRQGISEESTGGQKEGLNLSSHVDMRPQVQSSHLAVSNGVAIHGREDRNPANSRPLDQWRKQDDFFPGPLPLVRLNPRSDWADDERDTSHGLTDRNRDHGFSRPEAYWDRDFDLPRSSFQPLKPAQNLFDRRGQRDDDVGKGLPNEVSNADPFSRNARAPSREGHEGHSWRTSVSKDGFGSKDVINERNSNGARSTNMHREMNKDNKYYPSQYGRNTRDEYNVGPTANRDYVSGRRDHGRYQWNNSSELNNRGSERNTRNMYGNYSNRFKTDAVQSGTGLRPSFSPGNKGLLGSDHSLNIGRDKRSTSRNEKPYVEDPYSSFEGQDPFPGSILGVVKRKKDASKQLNFHDPVRESFEAELERVQKIQEQERQRIVEEQERALEMARREEEERRRVAREQEEHQRMLEEKAREAAWRAEQESLEAIRRAEEQRIAREEEKQRLMMEEERRKQAAKQKLLELEERIAKRQAETAKSNNSVAIPGDVMPSVAKERDVSRADDFACWEDGERMVERITNSASSDSSLGRSFDMGSRAVSAREGSFGITDRGKPFTSWRRDMFENGNNSFFFSSDHENGHQSPRREVSMGGRSLPRKDLYGGQGYMPTRGYYRGGISEPHMDDFPPIRGHRWNISGDGDQYIRNMELEADFPDVADRFDLGWGQGRGRGNSPFPDRYYQNADLDDLYTYGRSRYPARQPRVLPPPSLPSVHRTSFRGESEHPETSAYEDRNLQLNQALRSESAGGSYQIAQNEHLEILDASDQSAKNGEQERDRSITPGRDSQSSLSVSSPPSSPTHLSHDELDDSRESLAMPDRTEGQDISLSENEALLSSADLVKCSILTTASSESVGDDEEWAIENSDDLQEQEEYDEDVGYHEEDEVHEGDGEKVELSREFDNVHMEEKDPHHVDNLVLGFDQGVEVGLPNEDYEKCPGVDESLFGGSQTTVSIVEQKESLDGSRDGLSSQALDVSQLVKNDGSCVMAHETEKAVEPTSTSISLDSLNTGDSNPNTVLSSQQLASSSFGTNTHQALPNVTGTQALADFPVKLQFGLFSGPSLIPSPVPAIQIGSIQMPLQLHPQIGPSLTHMHAPQPPLFQFGQLRYPSPISQGILPMAPQSMSFVQPNVSPIYSSSQVPGGPSSVQPGQDSSHSSLKDVALSHLMKNHHVQRPHQLNANQNTESKNANLLGTSTAGSNALLSQNREGDYDTNQVRVELGQQVDNLGRPCNIARNSKPLLSNKASDGRVGPTSHSVAHVKGSSGPSAQSQFGGNRGRRFAFSARNPGARSFPPANEAYRSDTNGFQRKPRRGAQRFEFRIRQTADGKQPSNSPGLDAKSNADAKGTGTLPMNNLTKELPSDTPKETVGSELSSSDQINAQVTGLGIETDKTTRLATAAASEQDASQRVEGSLKRNISSEDDVDAPLQSGIVRVFKQSGIETPSDEDDFIEVRSKRQMLNDRRERREKENKAKSSNMRKAQRKSRSAVQGTATTRSTSRTTASLSAQGTKSVQSAVLTKRGLLNNEASATLNNAVPQLLAPIGTPPMGADSQADSKAQTMKPSQTSSYASSGQTVGPDVPDMAFDAQGKVADGVLSSLTSWSSPSINQPVMALTQTQLEEAMKPARFDTHIISIGDRGSSVNDQSMTSSSVLVKDTPFSSATSPISSLLAGEKIQFGAVTSPTLLPPTTRAPPNIRPPASLPLDVQISQSMPASQSNRDVLFEKEKRPIESCPPLEDCEAEAEAAASAVAVAAIGNDEVVGNGIGSCSTVISVSKGFGGADVNGITTGMSGDQHAVTQTKAEETLSVSLPADLSVETPPMSIWPPLPSPHNSSSQMLSPFPGGSASHFPFYDMNPMMGGPIFAFGPQEESAGPQPQQQKSSVTSSGPLGTWQQCHTGVDSFYGPPAGFTAPFLSPPGSIPGVQGPPHMVVYNHFAPVGQFGQVGLSYMGTTYIPSGKQPDWKRSSTSTLVGGEGEMNSANLIPVQRSAPNVPTQVQHLAPGSPLLSMASPMAMFEVSPFQSSPDVSMHSRWSNVQPPSIHTVPQSMPLQQQAEGAVPSRSTQGLADHHSLIANGFSQSQTLSSLEDSRSFAVVTNATASQFPDELGLVDQAVSTGLQSLALNVGSKNGLGDSVKVDHVDAVAEGSGSKRIPNVAVSAPSKALPAKQKNPVGQQQYNHYHRGLKNGSGVEWSSRKSGFHGRNYSSGGERSFVPPTKVKQIYVAKQSSSTSGTGSSI